MAKIKTMMRLKAKGFKRDPMMGFTFPGIDPRVLKAIKRRMKRRRSIKKIKPKMTIGPVEPDGTIKVDFNTEMLNPSMINQRVYQKVFQFTMENQEDGSRIYGKIVKENKKRRLRELPKETAFDEK